MARFRGVLTLIIVGCILFLTGCREADPVRLLSEPNSGKPKNPWGPVGPMDLPFADGLFTYATPTYLDRESGMADTNIHAILQDRTGYLWFGTRGGLHRYDGYDFHIYQPAAEGYNSLSSGWIQCLAEDADGTVWIGTVKGLDRLNPKTGIITSYGHSAGNTYSLSSNTVTALYVDRDGVLWIGTAADATDAGLSGALHRYDPTLEGFIRYVPNPADPAGINQSIGISALYQDSSGFLWVGAAGGGLSRLNLETGEVLRFRYDSQSPEPILDIMIFDIAESPDGGIWIADTSGIGLLDPATGTYLRYSPPAAHTQSMPIVFSAAHFSGDASAVWFGDSSGGLKI